jgi:peptidyl-prolyl cis-trans isomerase C
MTFTRLTLAGLAAGAALAIAGCGNDAENAAAPASDPLGPGEVAVVNGERIPESVFRLYTLGALQKNADDLTPEERADVIDQLVTLKLMADEAEERGLTNERAIAAQVSFLRTQTLARLMAERFQQENPPSEAELRALYEERLPQLQSTQYKARHILVDTEETAAELIGELDAGADFATLAQEHSSDAASQGGDLGWFAADRMVEPFANAVQTLEVGSYSEAPVQTQYGWHVILLEDSRDQQAPGLESVRADLTTTVGREKLDAFVASLKEGAEIDAVGTQP